MLLFGLSRLSREAFLSVLYAVILFAFMLLGAAYFQPLGGGVYAILASGIRVPKVGGVYNFLTNGPVKLSFAFKVLGWLVSASGLVAPLIVVSEWFPHLYSQDVILVAVLLAAIASVLNVMHEVHLMRSESFAEVALIVGRVMKLPIDELDERSMKQLARAHYMDMSLIQIARILVCYGVALFAASRLELIQVNGDALVSPIDGILYAVSTANIISGQDVVMTGPWAAVLPVSFGVAIFVYLIFFITLTSEMIDDLAPKQALEDGLLEAISRPPKTQSPRSEEEVTLSMSGTSGDEVADSDSLKVQPVGSPPTTC